MVSKFIVSQAKLFLLLRWVGGSFFKNNSVGKSPGNHRLECKNAATALTAAVVACSTNNGEERYTRRITASDDSCVRGGQHGYEATGHAREKPICACEIGDLDKKVEVFAISDAAGPEKQ